MASDRGLGIVETRGVAIIGYAAKHGTVASDGPGGNSPFALALAEHLPTPGLDIRPGFGAVKDEVRRATADEQEPWLYQNLGRDELRIPLDAAPPTDGDEADD